jgi:hypothetical protein
VARIDAKRNPIVVDRGAGETNGATTISYEKTSDEVLWIRPPGKGWDAPNLFVLTGTAKADEAGVFAITLSPGDIFDIAIFRFGQTPIDEQIVQTRAEAFLKLFCVSRVSERTLITDENQQTGGTFHVHQIATNVNTSVARIGASRSQIMLDANGMPLMAELDGGPRIPPGFGSNHLVELVPLLAGNHYFFAAMVVDLNGNWEVMLREFNTLARILTVSFDVLHIFNDGDESLHGEAEFWFRVHFQGGPGQITVIEDFHRPEADIDDWSETDRPYTLSASFKHNGLSQRVHDGEEQVSVASWASEDDSPFGADGAGSAIGESLGVPAGKGVEVVSGRPFHLDCPPSTDGSSFHYGVDGTWSMTYVP